MALSAADKNRVNALKSLAQHGQAIWLDFLSRDFIADGRLTQLIERDGLAGLSSNPSIFEKAIDAGGSYDTPLKEALSAADCDAAGLYEQLAIPDIRAAADALRPVYDASERRDGLVSFELSPYLADDTAATIDEARRLWRAVGRPNLLIKVPATAAGLPAIRQLLSEGIGINVTLLFSQTVYEDVAEAYLAGLEAFIAAGGDASRLASVASFLVSRIDTAVDTLIDARIEKAAPAERDLLAGLRGKVAIANAKLAYRRFRRRFSGKRWNALRAKGARPQRLLWAMTDTKDPAFRNLLYVEELIGPDTVNTLPPATLDAFRDHGAPRASLEEDVAGAERVMAMLDRVGISIDAVTGKLVEDGVGLCADAADKLLGAIAHRRRTLLGERLDGQTMALPPPLAESVGRSLEDWRRAGNARRLWARDPRLWTASGEEGWLGWLDIVAQQQRRLRELAEFSEDVRAAGFAQVLLLGMGGSSLGPEVLGETFPRHNGHPELLVLDSTDPAQIRAIARRIDPARVLVIVSSKSGTTLEPDILRDYFVARLRSALGPEGARTRFVAITDPGSALETVARRDGFRRIFFGRPDIGGRYSVLSDFGMAPAAAIGLDLPRLLASAQAMVLSSDASVPPAENPGIVLGTVLGLAAKGGRDKVTLSTSPGLADFGSWLEQLLAESTGKRGQGLIPVDGEALGPPEVYGADRVFVDIGLAAEADATRDGALARLEQAGHPVVRIAVTDRYHLGQEFFRWQIATATAGAIIGVNPFDQPDVEASKVKTRELTAAYERSRALPPETPLAVEDGIQIFADPANADALRRTAATGSLDAILKAHLVRLGAGDYCALLAYIERNAAHRQALHAIRSLIRDRRRVATCVGFGPRFLHSTGQAYKGGANSGLFLQITCADREDLAVPGWPYGFGIVKAAQARGDLAVLAEHGRRALRLHLGADVEKDLARLEDAVRRALV
jgi:transaldolase / glucose-6-phosphate isomerase